MNYFLEVIDMKPMCEASERCRSKDKRGFTILEILIVLIVIGLLVAIAIPATQSVIISSRSATCSNHLRQIGTAIHAYVSSHSVLPPGLVLTDSYRGFGWAVMLLPELEEKSLYDTISFEDGLLATHNQSAVATSLISFRCPSDSTLAPRLPQRIAQGSYVASCGNRSTNTGLFFQNSSVTLEDMMDGVAMTIAFSERSCIKCRYYVAWRP